MVGKSEQNKQLNMYKTPLIHFIDTSHELCQLTERIDWNKLEEEFKDFYAQLGRPSIPIRKMVGLVVLKHLKNLSDENTVATWKENPYWQYFTGEVYFQTDKPIEPSEFVHFRKRIGEKGCEKILKMSVDLFGKEAQESEIQIDTTVQEKNITFPTDTKLHKKIIEKCWTLAEMENIKLRQSYKRTIRQLMLEQRNRTHPKRKKKATAASRKIKTIAGRLVRDVERKLPEHALAFHKNKLGFYHKILEQQKDTKDKIYSLHEPDVKCIAKGKEAKKYEFGNKSSIAKTRKSGIIVGALGFKDNLYDGDTLPAQLEQIKRITGKEPKIASVDRGYRGRLKVGNTHIAFPKPPKQSATNYQKSRDRKRFRARASIEPVIGHIKHDHRMIRNYLSGVQGDKVNTILAATAFNLKKMLNRIAEQTLNNFTSYSYRLFLWYLQPKLMVLKN